MEIAQFAGFGGVFLSLRDIAKAASGVALHLVVGIESLGEGSHHAPQS